MKNLPDFLVVLGTVAVVYGIYAVYPPAAWIVGGACSLAIGLLMARSEKR